MKWLEKLQWKLKGKHYIQTGKLIKTCKTCKKHCLCAHIGFKHISMEETEKWSLSFGGNKLDKYKRHGNSEKDIWW